MLNSLIAKPVENPAAAALFKKQLQWMLFLRVVFLTIILGINLLLQSAEKHVITPPFYYVVIFIAGLYVYTICSAILLKSIKRYTTFAYAQILIDVFLVSILIYYSGGSQSIFTILFFFLLILCGCLSLGRGRFSVCMTSKVFFVLLGDYIK